MRGTGCGPRPAGSGTCSPGCCGQSEYNERLKALAPLMEVALRWLADRTPATAEMLRLMDATAVLCGTSAVTARRSGLYGWAGYGYCPNHSRWPSSAAVLAHASRSQLSSSHRPIATRLTA